MTIPPLPRGLPPAQQLSLTLPATGFMTQPWQEYFLSFDAFVRKNANPNFTGDVTADANALGHTIPTATFIGGVDLRSGPVGAFNDTTPTAAQIIAAIPNCIVNSTRLIMISNAGGGLMTLLAGSGVTLAGTTTVAAGNVRLYLVSVTNITVGSEAVTLRGLMTAAS